MFGLSPVELLVIGAVAVLLFGSRLPSVARSMGKSVTEFKKGLHGIQDELDVDSTSARRQPPRSNLSDDREDTAVPKFEPPVAEPQEEHRA